MVKKVAEGEAPVADPEAEQRKKLKSLAFSRKLFSRAPAKAPAPLEPSKSVQKHQGRDVVKKGQRKNRFLFSFPGLLAPISGGKIGELANLNTRNPVLYLEFPQGRMKLFGTVVYSKNKYLTLQFSRSSKGVLCEDSFDNMIVFSEAWWIGRKEDNPEEIQLDFPAELDVGSNLDFDFSGGAGATIGTKLDSNKQTKELVEHLSPKTELRDEASDDFDLVSEEKETKTMEETPVRHSARTAGKSLNYAESSSGDDSNCSAADKSEMIEEEVHGNIDGATESSRVASKIDGATESSRVASKIDGATESSRVAKNENSTLETLHFHKENEEVKTQSTGKVKRHHMRSSEENSPGKRGALVQATLSTLFDKAAKKSKSTTASSPGLKDVISKRPRNNSKQLSKAVKGKALDSKIETGGKKSGAGSLLKKKKSQVQNDDDIEDISSDVKELDDSDEDWTS